MSTPRREADRSALGALRRDAQLVHFADGARVFELGAPPPGFVLVQSGTVRIHQLTADGREIVFYRLSAGEACVMTLSALLEHNVYAAYAVAEGPVDILLLPVGAFERQLADAPRFRAFVFDEYARQFTRLVGLINDMVDTPLVVRLARALLSRAAGGAMVPITHAALAAEVGSAREVISRALKSLESRGIVRRQRGALVLCDRTALARLAAR